MERFIESFRQIGNLTPQNEKVLLGSINKKNFPAKTLLQNQDRISDKIYFVEEGVARTYYIKNGKDITHWLAFDGDFVGSMTSFFMRRPSNKIVETIEDSILWEFEYNKLNKLFSTNIEMERAGRLFAIYGLYLMEERLDNLYFQTAKERYNILLKKQPRIIQRVPLGMIASYLGVTQETLSRIRASK